MKSDTIVGYTYGCENLCPGCTLNAVSGNSTAYVEFDYSNEAVESWLRTTALEQGINYDDERSYDTSEFPKVIFADQAEPQEICSECHERLIESDSVDQTSSTRSALTVAQFRKLRDLCKRYKVTFTPSDYHPQFDCPPGYFGGWVGGSAQAGKTIYVGVSPEGDSHS